MNETVETLIPVMPRRMGFPLRRSPTTGKRYAADADVVLRLRREQYGFCQCATTDACRMLQVTGVS